MLRMLCLWCGLAVGSLSAATIQEWNFTNARVPGMNYSAKQIAFQCSTEKTPDGDPAGEFMILNSPAEKAVAWSAQINFVTTQKIEKNVRYTYRFFVKSDRDVVFSTNFLQNEKPWKTIGASGIRVCANSGWQTVSRQFTANMDWEGKSRLMLMVGNLPKETKLFIGPIHLEVNPSVLPLSLNPVWNVFESPKLEPFSAAAYSTVPAELGGVTARGMPLKDNAIVFPNPLKEKQLAILFNAFTAPEDGRMQIGVSADYWFVFSVNGETVYSTLSTGNRSTKYLPTDHVFNFPVKKGKNLIAVQLLSGSSGWRLVCGQVPFREKVDTITEIKRGKEWRPVKMDDVHWAHITPKRIDQFKRIPGSALDLSQYVKAYDIDRCGRLKADSAGNLYFENLPGEKVRLRGFNFTPNSWNHCFYQFSHQEIEEFAEQIRLAGMNVLRFHFLDGALAGNSGLPKSAKNRHDIAEVAMAQEVSELPIDKKFADRWYYFLKCARDRGIYVMFDIFTSPGLMTEAVQAKEYPRYQMFHNEKYRKHWNAAFDFLLKIPNPYTGKAMIDDPQLMAITFYNEQEHLFNFAKGGNIERFTPQWQKYSGKTSNLNGALLSEDSPDGALARKFLRDEIRKMNAFYLKKVKDSGFQGFVTNWDMYMRNLEGDARRDFNAVAMHTYHAHPNKAKLYPETYQQKLTYGKWLRGTMTTVSQESSIQMVNSYLGRAAATRVLGKPFFMTEYSHCGYNRYTQESGPMWAATASLQDWQMLAPHANLAGLYYQPFQPGNFDSMNNLSGVLSSLFCAFGWQRGDIAAAKHSVSFHIPEKLLESPAYTGAIGSGYNALFMLTRIGSDYKAAVNPAATLNLVPMQFSTAVNMGMWVRLSEKPETVFFTLRDQVANLRAKGILPKDNQTDVNAGIFQSETGEIITDTRKQTLRINTPKFQAAVCKKSGDAGLGNLAVKSVSTPCTIAAISLRNSMSLADSDRILLIVATMFSAEDAVFSTPDFDAELDVGDMKQVMRSGKFSFSLKTARKTMPKVYALNLNGSREAEIPVRLADGKLDFELDTSILPYGTPYFEIVY